MTKAELNEIIKNALTSNTLNTKKYFEVRTSANERCREYISKQPDKDRPGFTDYIDFQMESLYYSAIEESVNATINVLVSLGVLQVDD